MKNHGMTQKIPARFLCADIERLMDDYLDDVLDSGERQMYERHLKNCEHCASMVCDIENIVSIASSLSQTPVPPAVKDRLRQTLVAETDYQIPRKKPLPRADLRLVHRK